MKRLLLAAGALSLLVAAGKGKTPIDRGQNPVVFRMPLTDTGATSSLAGSFGEPLTFTRASTGTYVVGGVVLTALANQARTEATGLLLEPATTNHVIRSEEFDNGAWARSFVVAPTANSAVAPDGATTADTLTSDGDAGYIESTAYTVVASSYSASVWAKTSAGTQGFVMRIWNQTGGAVFVTCSKTATTTWQRFTCSASGNATSGNSHTFQIQPGGASTGTIIAWGAQVENPGPFANAGTSFVTSYVPTAGTQVARAPDNVSAQNAAMFDVHREGSWTTTFRPNGWSTANMPANPSIIKLLTATDTDLTDVFCHGSGCSCRWGGGTAAVAQSFVDGTEYRIRCYWKHGGPVCLSINGGAETCSGNLSPAPVALAKFWLGTSTTANLPSSNLTDVCVARTQDGCR